MKNIDDFMRQKFDTDDPASRFEFREEYWEQAQAMLEAEEKRRRKRRRWLLWWFCLVGVAVAVAVFSNGGSRQEQSAEESGRNNGSRQEQTLGERSAGSNAVQAQGDAPSEGTISEEKTPNANSALLKNKTDNQHFETKNEAKKNLFSSENSSAKIGKIPANNPQVQVESKAGNDALAKGQPETANNSFSVFDTSTVSKNELNDLAALPTLAKLLQLPPRNLETPYVTVAAREINPVREQRFTFGLTASASFSQISPDGKWLGGIGGAFAEYRFAPAWSLNAGLQWRFLSGDWRADSIVAETSTQLRYGFGFQQDEYSLETQGLHFIELPIGLQWRQKAFGLEAGVAPGFLVGVQGRLTQSRSESLQEGISETRSRVWLDKSPYRSAYVAPFLGLEWLATQRLGLSLRGVYHPGSLAKENPDAPPPGGLFWLDAGLRLRF